MSDAVLKGLCIFLINMDISTLDELFLSSKVESIERETVQTDISST